MKAKKILLSILAIVIIAVALLFIYGTTQPKEVSLTRSIVIDHDIRTVYSYVSDFRNWKEWSAWNLRDTTMEVVYSGNVAGTGAVMSWTSDDSGNGTQTIVEAVPYSLIKTELDFGSMGTALSDWEFEPTAEGTKVTWGFKSETGGPFVRGLMALFFNMEEAVGKDYDEGLQNLKAKIESLPMVKRFDISETEVAGFYYLGVVNTLEDFDMEAVSNAYTKSYGDIEKVLQESKLEPKGAPICIVHEYTPEKMVFEPAMVVGKLPSKPTGIINKGEVKPGKAVKGIYLGDYAEMESAYEEIKKYAEDKGYQISGKIWEVYVTDPALEKDTAKWETHIFYPITM